MNEQNNLQNYGILFDMDGVLISLVARWINPVEEIITSVNPNFDRERIRDEGSSLRLIQGGKKSLWLIKGITQICKLGGLSRFQTLRVITIVGLRAITRKRFPIIPLEGAVETLDSLKKMGFKLALVTSASKFTIKKLEKEYPAIYNKFDTIVTRSDVKFTKPSPDQLNAALMNLRVEKQYAVMVGDFVSDILAGKNAGIKTVAVLGEFAELSRPILESANPDLIIINVTELPKYLLHLFAP